MLELFSKDGDGRQLQHKTAYYIDDAGNKEAFKYIQVSSKDLSQDDFLQNINMQGYEFTIRTSNRRNFKLDDTILIDGVRFMITNLSKEMRDQANGIFRKNMLPFQLITLKR